MEARDITIPGESLKCCFFRGIDCRFFWLALENREPDMDSLFLCCWEEVGGSSNCCYELVIFKWWCSLLALTFFITFFVGRITWMVVCLLFVGLSSEEEPVFIRWFYRTTLPTIGYYSLFVWSFNKSVIA